MSAQESDDRKSHKDNRSADQIERDLASTREHLGETLEALTAKLDVKSRATEWTKETVERVQIQARVLIEERGPEVRLAAGAAGLALVALLVRKSRR
ncbi:MAG: DUF3618 domain-containing protein [Demequina sp.]